MEQFSQRQKKEKNPAHSSCFQEALSNFTYDAASGRAIRHLAGAGYSVKQIMERLDYPTPQRKVEQTVYQYMKEKHILLETLPMPKETFPVISLPNLSAARLSSYLQEYIQKDGEDFSYVSCPFGGMKHKQEEKLEQLLSCLTSREKDYILGIPWDKEMMYHQLNRRMREISIQLALSSDRDSDMKFTFYFLKSQRKIEVE